MGRKRMDQKVRTRSVAVSMRGALVTSIEKAVELEDSNFSRICREGIIRELKRLERKHGRPILEDGADA